MTSPDVTPYVDLTLFDRSANDIAVAALQDAAIKLPDVTLREGLTEVVLIESLALEVAENIRAINRLPGAIFTVVMRLFGIVRDVGAPPITDVGFTLSDTLGHTIPAGTEVVLDLGGGQTPIIFTTQADVIVPAASATGTASAAIGSRNTVAANGVTSGTPLRIRSSVAFLQSAETASTVTLGRDAETDAAYFLRSAQRLQRLTNALVLPQHFTSAALEDPAVFRALTIDLYDGAGGPPYTDVGHVTVVARGESGNLSAPQKAALTATLDAQAMAPIIVHVIDPTTTNVNVTATAVAKSGYDPSTVQAAIGAAITAFLDPAQWPWDATVRRNDLIALIENVPGVDYLTAGHPVTPAADVPLSGDGPLANAGTLTITVT